MKIKKEFVLRNMADEYLLIPTGATTEEFNGMITISETGAFLWEHLEKAENEDDLLTMVLEEYDADPEIVIKEITLFLNELRKYGMIE